MKGKVTITVDDTGTHMSLDFEDVTKNDRMFLVHALGVALKLEPMEYEVLAMAEAFEALEPDSVKDLTEEVQHES